MLVGVEDGGINESEDVDVTDVTKTNKKIQIKKCFRLFIYLIYLFLSLCCCNLFKMSSFVQSSDFSKNINFTFVTLTKSLGSVDHVTTCD